MTPQTFDDRSPVLKLEEANSTNAEALRRAAGGERGPLWITARRQTAGRGRSGRFWQQPDGNLAASFLFAPAGPISNLHQLSLLTGVVVHEAVVDACGGVVPGLRLKWPNDILVGRAKAGGILVESTSWHGATIGVIGIGLNLVAAPMIEGRDVAHLGAWAPGLSVEGVLAALDRSMRKWLWRWNGGAGFADVRAAWLEVGGALGEPLTVNAGKDRHDGRFEGIDGSGALLLRAVDGRLVRLTYGDVSFSSAAFAPTGGC